MLTDLALLLQVDTRIIPYSGPCVKYHRMAGYYLRKPETVSLHLKGLPKTGTTWIEVCIPISLPCWGEAGDCADRLDRLAYATPGPALPRMPTVDTLCFEESSSRLASLCPHPLAFPPRALSLIRPSSDFFLLPARHIIPCVPSHSPPPGRSLAMHPLFRSLFLSWGALHVWRQMIITELLQRICDEHLYTYCRHEHRYEPGHNRQLHLTIPSQEKDDNSAAVIQFTIKYKHQPTYNWSCDHLDSLETFMEDCEQVKLHRLRNPVGASAPSPAL